MNPEDELRRLAGALGIPATYRDASGRMRDVPATSLRAVCAVLGFDASDEAAAQSSLASFTRARSAEFLPPVIAVRGAGSPIEIPLNLPHAAADRMLEWELREESGRTHGGEVKTQDLVPKVDAPTPAEGIAGACLRLDLGLPPGYHELRVRVVADAPIEDVARLILAPLRAYQPPKLESGERVWALSTQLYALRSAANWGIGDFSDLAEVMACAARCGAAGVGINPLHSLFRDDPERASPYSPSSRLFLNPIYLDLTAIEDFQASDEVRALRSSHDFLSVLRHLRDNALVDYSGVASLKQRVLDLLYAQFRRRHLDDANDGRGRGFRTFQASGGAALRQFAVFEALREHFGASNPEMRDWRRWPQEFRSPESPAVSAFADRNVQRVEFFEYLQWEADRQLRRAADCAARAALPIGLYRDLAIGVDCAGADAWAHQDVIVGGFSVGAPPDAWAPGGQNWGFPPLHPVTLRRSGYRMFIDVLRANMRSAGALRIDHVLGLMRTFWIPDGCTAADGAYVHYPFDELLAIVVLESHRNKCLVIGEDLGTLPEGLREALQAAGLYSYRLLYFERAEGGRFLRPDEYPVEAVAAVSTHDLPTVIGYWRGHDIELRETARDTAVPEESKRARDERSRDRDLMLDALRHAGVAEIDADARDPPLAPIHRFLAMSRSRLVLVQIEDLVRQVEQMNLPGTDREVPNWRRKLPETLTEIFADAGVHDLLAVMSGERPLPAATPLMPRRHAPPHATYRMQLNSEFGFADLQGVLAYLCEIGISHVYVSPFLRARPGSTHGYDIIDHGAINTEIGDERALDRLCAALRALDMGMILDFVPNHIGVGHADNNEWWLDMLQWGSSSPYAHFFDIDWESPKRELSGKVLLPFLGDHYGAVLERGELRLVFEPAAGSFGVRYFDHRYPLRPRHYALLLRRGLELDAPAGDEGLASRVRTLADAFSELRPETQSRARQMEIWRRGNTLKEELAEIAKDPTVSDWIDRATATFNGTPGETATFRPLHRLLERQAYRLAFWRVAADEINYRRFFDINDLVGIRQENPTLFQQSHRLIGQLIAEDKIQGLRIDHIDGLFDPASYCRQLCAFARAMLPEERRSFYVVLEKILAADEQLRHDWAADGTTGYDFLGSVTRLFIDPAGEPGLDETYRQFTGDGRTFERHALECRHLVMESILSSELNVLARALDRISEEHWSSRDYTLERLRHALREIIARFPVYRTYVAPSGCSAEDRRYILTAVERARRSWMGPDRQILDFVSAALTGDLVKDRTSGFNRNDVLRFAMRFQQYTAPVTAKAVEDTAYYRYGRLVSLNEVGCAPQPFSISPADFHQIGRDRLRSWPRALLATATHDTKRGEDLRMRLNLLSEVPQRWAEAVQRWRRWNRSLRSDVGDRRAPSRPDEYILYQTLVGAWPAALVDDGSAWPSGLGEFRARIKDYLVKAVREAKTVSSWTDQDEPYEKGCLAFLDAILDENGNNAFLGDCRAFVRHIAFAAVLSSLAQIVLKCFSPGVPDIYQGTEFWDLSLVDPDNRRAVDFDARRTALAALSGAGTGEDSCGSVNVDRLLRGWPDGRIKLHVLRQSLQLRRMRPLLFAHGSYEPLMVEGERSHHVVAFTRRHEDEVAVIAVGRLFAALQIRSDEPTALDWGESALPVDELGQADLVEAFTGRRIVAQTADGASRIPLRNLFAPLPIAVLTASQTKPPPRRPRSGSRP
jgi:(1->4)-alpha-D-glucan 1-alpha-D-glucosylmutase